MARKPAASGPTPVEVYTHDEATRTNIPTADGADRWADPESLEREPVVYARFAGIAAERASRNEALDPQLVWRGKDQQDDDDLVVEAPPLYIQEKIDPRVLVENLRRSVVERAQRDETQEPETLDIFGDFDGELDELQQIEYYQHDAAWSNRMILGDSLQAMGSLAERESMRGKVQMIYIDPPYGIKFNSNWQVSASKRDVKDGKDAAREAEQIKAFRDTWKDGIHTYLSYLRDRLVVARDLLTESGSVFVQIGDENVHRVRALMDEVFGAENFVSQIAFKKTSGTSTTELAGVFDHLLWFSRRRETLKYHALYFEKVAGGRGGGQYTWLEFPDGTRRRAHKSEILNPPPGTKFFRGDQLTSQRPAQGTDLRSFDFDGRAFTPGAGTFKTDLRGLKSLRSANRLLAQGNTLSYVRFIDDFPALPMSNLWDDTVRSGFADVNLYVVQTMTRVIERCMLMTTDPGDLVLDPTCGSGTTAYVAEQWGRRWITMDTSRVALALARQRLMGGRYPYYLLADSPEGRAKEAQASGHLMPPAETKGDIRQGFVYERVQHITLKSIANNPDIREGMTRDEVDAAIKKHADFELLYDKPYEDKKRVRVTGPFTVESLSPYRTLDQQGEPSRSEKAGAADAMGADYTQTIIGNLRSAGIQNGRRQERIEFTLLDEHAGTHVQAIGERTAAGTDDASTGSATHDPSSATQEPGPATHDRAPGRVAIAIGPEYGTVSAGFVREAAKEALADKDVDMLCVLGFSFEPNVTSTVTDVDGVDIDITDDGFASISGERKLGRLRVLFVRMNAELLMGDALKKTGAGNLFTVFGEPDVQIRPASDGSDRIEAEIFGVDVYDAAINRVRSRDTKDIALWMIDTNYNEESFFVRHCYFTGGNDPMKKLKVALKADINADAWEQLYRTTSMPFERPATGKIAIKVINDYGDEVMKVYDVA